MTNYQTTPQGKDPELWDIARKRASFKGHLATYIIMNIFFWALWYFNGGRTYNSGLPWPVWPMFGWGIGVAFHYIGAYVSNSINSTQKEYDKLIEKQTKNNL